MWTLCTLCSFVSKPVISLLQIVCTVSMWFRTLLRRLRDLNLQRRDHASPMLAVWNAVQAELRVPGDCAV